MRNANRNSGTRGAASYTIDTLDAHIELTQLILGLLNDTNVYFLPNRTEANDLFINDASVNLRDQVRKDETIPLQFAYEAADCRIWYTPQTLYNYTALWQYAADSIWGSKNLCVSGSMGYATSTNKTDFVGPASLASIATVSVSDIVSHLTTDGTTRIPYLNDGLEDTPTGQQNSGTNTPILCSSSSDCTSITGTVCAEVTTCLNGFWAIQKQCVTNCPRNQAPCTGPNNNKCQFEKNICTNKSKPCAIVKTATLNTGGQSTFSTSKKILPGICLPTLTGAVVIGKQCQAQTSGGVQTTQSQLSVLRNNKVI